MRGMKRDGRTLALQRMREGESPADVSASFGLNRTWAYKVRNAARGRGNGLRALRSTKATGRPRSLTCAQERQVFGWVNGKNPLQYGFDFGLWTRQIVRELVAKRFEVDLSLASIGSLLACLGLTAQKPLERAYQRDPQAIEQWMTQTYPALAGRAKREKAEVFFWDESGFRADCVHGKTWAAKGKSPVVLRPGQRQTISAASAVNSKGAFWFETYEGALTGELFVMLLEHMMSKRKRAVHLVIDGLPAHKKAVVKEYVKSTIGRLTLHFLPRYAPDLNPDELVWSHAKRSGVARNPLRKGEILRDRVDAQLQSVADNPALVQSFFKHPFVAYITDC